MTRLRKAALAIFDHDGVLIDSLASHQQSWLDLGRQTGLPITAEFVRETFGRTNPDILRMLLGDDAGEEQIREHGETKEALYREIAAPSLTLMAGVRELLDRLTASGLLLAIGSSGPRKNLELTVARCGLEGRFAAIAGLEDITRGKPDPQVFLVAAERAGVPPGRCVVFEDAPIGIEAARAAGMIAVGVGTTHPLDSLSAAGADVVTPTLADFPLDDLLSRFASS